MSDDEIATFLEQSRTATMATIGPNGLPHLVAMWYGLIDGKIYFETKAKSQKVAEPAARPADRRARWRPASATTSSAACRSRAPPRSSRTPTTTSTGPPASACSSATRASTREEMRPFVEMMMNKRVVVRVEPTRVRSWDHRKLGQGEMPIAGSTAAVPLTGRAHLRRHRVGVGHRAGHLRTARARRASGDRRRPPRRLDHGRPGDAVGTRRPRRGGHHRQRQPHRRHRGQRGCHGGAGAVRAGELLRCRRHPRGTASRSWPPRTRPVRWPPRRHRS